jgi:hypothetical protein
VSSGPTGPERPLGRIEIRGGGVVAPEELAALVVALTPVGGGEGHAAGAGGRSVPAWTTAALSEGVGGPRVDDPGAVGSFGTRP